MKTKEEKILEMRKAIIETLSNNKDNPLTMRELKYSVSVNYDIPINRLHGVALRLMKEGKIIEHKTYTLAD